MLHVEYFIMVDITAYIFFFPLQVPGEIAEVAIAIVDYITLTYKPEQCGARITLTG